MSLMQQPIYEQAVLFLAALGFVGQGGSGGWSLRGESLCFLLGAQIILLRCPRLALNVHLV